MKKLILILFIGSVTAAFVIVFGGRKLFKLGTDKASSFIKEKTETMAKEAAQKVSTQTVTAPALSTTTVVTSTAAAKPAAVVNPAKTKPAVKKKHKGKKVRRKVKKKI